MMHGKSSVIGHSLTTAQTLLEQAEVVAIPTETVYGLAANAYAIEAVEKIFAVKHRPYSDPLIVHTSSVARTQNLVKTFSTLAQRLATAFWPGPLTLLLPKKAIIPDIVTAGLSLVGIRVPQHPVAQALLTQLPFPLAAPSANPFGYISPTTAKHVADQLGDHIPYILDGGACTNGLESTIIGGLENDVPTIYRLGSITEEDIAAVLGQRPRIHQNVDTPTVTKDDMILPGSLPNHYAPRTPLVIGEPQALLAQHQGKKVGLLLFQKEVVGCPATSPQLILAPDGNLQTAAQRFFAFLRQLDQTDLDMILAERLPQVGLGKTMNERLTRASHAT